MKRIVFSIIGVLVSILLNAQSAIPATGGNISIGGIGSVSYTVGQVVYTTNSDETSGSVSQGVQQPYEISVVTGIEEALGISLEIMVYPNPATDFLTLKVMNYDKENLSYWFYDFNGNLLQNKKVEDNECNVSMQNLLSGTYILKVTDNIKVIKTFKIIKH